MLKGVLVKVCLPVVLGFVNAFQVSLQNMQASYKLHLCARSREELEWLPTDTHSIRTRSNQKHRTT